MKCTASFIHWHSNIQLATNNHLYVKHLWPKSKWNQVINVLSRTDHWIKVNSALKKYKGQWYYKNEWLPNWPLNHSKPSDPRVSEGNNQATTISTISANWILDPGHESFNRRRDRPLLCITIYQSMMRSQNLKAGQGRHWHIQPWKLSKTNYATNIWARKSRHS